MIGYTNTDAGFKQRLRKEAHSALNVYAPSPPLDLK